MLSLKNFRSPIKFHGTGTTFRRNAAKPHAKRSEGFMLLEVLVGLLLFSLGMLGMINLHAQSIRFSVTAFERNRAALMANELVNTMWAAGTVELASDTLSTWKNRLADEKASGLRSATVTITSLDNNGTVQIVINWQSIARGQSHAGGSYMTEFVIPPAAVI